MKAELVLQPQGIMDLYYPEHHLSSPYTEQMESIAAQWINAYTCLSPETKYKTKKACYGKLTAEIFPNASFDLLIPMTRWMLWAFVFDDYFGPNPKDALREVCQKAIHILAGKEPEADDHELFRELAVIRNELRDISSPDWMRRFVNNHRYYFRGLLMDTYSYQRNISYPTPDHYLVIRDRLIGGFMVCDLIELASGKPFSNSLVNHQDIQRIRLLASRLMIWDNDLFSYEKEIAEGEAMNYVLVLMEHEGLTLDEAVARTIRKRNNDLEELLDIQQSLEDFGIQRRQVERYMDNLMILLKGQLDWYLRISRRYH